MVAQTYVDCSTCQGIGKIYIEPKINVNYAMVQVIEETKILEFEIPKGSPDHGLIYKMENPINFQEKLLVMSYWNTNANHIKCLPEKMTICISKSKYR